MRIGAFNVLARNMKIRRIFFARNPANIYMRYDQSPKNSTKRRDHTNGRCSLQNCNHSVLGGTYYTELVGDTFNSILVYVMLNSCLR